MLTKEKRMDLVNNIVRYENDEMSDEETITFFQALVDNGMAWNLQGHYGRMATHLIEEGFISEVNNEKGFSSKTKTLHTEEK